MSMAEFEIGSLLAETNSLDASLNLEPSLSSLLEATTNTSSPLMDSFVTSFSLDHTSNSMSTNRIRSSQSFATMPTPSLPTPDAVIDYSSISVHPATSSLMDIPTSFISTQSLQIDKQPNLVYASPTPQHISMSLPNPDPPLEIATTHFAKRNLFFYQPPPPPPPPSYSFNIEHQALHTQTQTSGVEYKLPFELTPNQHSTSNFANGIRDVFSQHQEAVASFLAGKVRPGPDVARIYKCEECSAEFPTAQAFGGHMTAHNYAKRSKNPVEAEGSKSKKNKLSRKKKVAHKKLVVNDENVQKEHDDEKDTLE